MAGSRATRLGLLLLLAVLVADLWFSYSRVDPIPAVKPLTLVSDDRLVGAYRSAGGNQWLVGLYGLILHRAPGAANWQVVRSATDQALLAIAFAPDNLHGFAVGASGVIVATSDGGKSWLPRNSGTDRQLLDVYAIDASHACAVGAFGTVLLSSNGGASWQTVSMPWDRLLPAMAKEYGVIEPALNSVFFLSPRIGCAVGEFGVILRTSDGGATWQAIRSGTLDSPQLVGVAFQGERAGWAVAQDGSTLTTGDRGESWSQARPGAGRTELMADTLAIRLDGQHRTLRLLTLGNQGPILRLAEQHGS